jgi:hypothetical protein
MPKIRSGSLNVSIAQMHLVFALALMEADLGFRLLMR